MNSKDLCSTLAKISKDADQKELTVKHIVDLLDYAALEIETTGKTAMDFKKLSEMLKKSFEMETK
jgi:hypothetical protein